MADAPPPSQVEEPISSSHEQLAIEPDTHRTDDEGFQQSSTSSLLSSIASEIKEGKVKHGRVFANYGKHEYGLPIDEEELDRLDMNHTKYQMLLGGRLFLAPIGPNPQSILDIATGTGIWAIDMADKFPSASVIGTDIAPVQPQWVPPNLQFQLDDAEQEWTFAPDSFDFIHQRDFYQGIRDWPRFAQQCFKHLRPGGYTEWCSVHAYPKSDDNTLPEGAAIRELSTTFEELTIGIGCDPKYSESFKKWLEEAGFVDVVEKVYKIPSSPWPKDPTMKKIGAFEYLNVVEGAEGFLINKYAEYMGRSLEELEDLVARLRRELSLNKYHCYVSFYVVHGRKPE